MLPTAAVGALRVLITCMLNEINRQHNNFSITQRDWLSDCTLGAAFGTALG
jgi:hypothetical protein